MVKPMWMLTAYEDDFQYNLTKEKYQDYELKVDLWKALLFKV